LVTSISLQPAANGASRKAEMKTIAVMLPGRS
jgi:hypothetical protein